MRIAHQTIGSGNPCFIIAEAGSNHNQDLPTAKALIDAAAKAKADAVKFQLFKAEKHYSRKTPVFEYLKKQGIKQNIVDLLKDMELPRQWLSQLRDYAKEKGIILFSSVTSQEDVDLCVQLDLPCLKIASFELVDIPLIAHCARTQKPLILSTGLADMQDIQDAYEAVVGANNRDLALLQCASLYPAPERLMNLKAMLTLREKFQVKVGLSDHTQGIHIAGAAVAMGAEIIEKHFTLSRSMPGPDHPFSLEPHELALMVQHIRDIESAMGTGVKGTRNVEEAEMYEKARRSIHAAMDIATGQVIEARHLTIKRPGYGIKPKYLNQLIGKKAVVNIEADDFITWEKLG